MIMQVVCESSQCPETAVKVVAMQCLVRIMSLYYQFMEQYMDALFPVCLLDLVDLDFLLIFMEFVIECFSFCFYLFCTL